MLWQGWYPKRVNFTNLANFTALKWVATGRPEGKVCPESSEIRGYRDAIAVGKVAPINFRSGSGLGLALWLAYLRFQAPSKI